MSILIFRRRHHTVPPFLAFTTQPGGANSGSAFSPQPVVTAKNPDGSTNTSFTGNVTLAVNTVTGSHALGGTTTVAAVAGVATFTTVTDTGSGNGTLTATATGYSSATSSSFTTAAGGTVNRSDNVNRADNASLGTPSDGGSAWQDRFGSFAVSGNQAKADALQSAGQPWSADNAVAVSTLTCSPNGTFTVAFPTQVGNQGIIFRYVDANNMWVAFIAGNYLYVDKVVGGVKTSIVSTQLSANYPNLGAGMKLQVVLTAANFVVKTITSGGTTATEYTLPGGNADWAASASAVEHGLYATNTSAPFDDVTWVGT